MNFGTHTLNLFKDQNELKKKKKNESIREKEGNVKTKKKVKSCDI